MGAYLLRTEAGWNPDVFLQSASGVIIRGGVPLEVVHQLGDGLLHLQRHGCHNMLCCTRCFRGGWYTCSCPQKGSQKYENKSDENMAALECLSSPFTRHHVDRTDLMANIKCTKMFVEPAKLRCQFYRCPLTRRSLLHFLY